MMAVGLVLVAIAAGCGPGRGAIHETTVPPGQVIEADGLKLAWWRQYGSVHSAAGLRMDVDEAGNAYVVGPLHEPPEPEEALAPNAWGFVAKVNWHGVRWVQEVRTGDYGVNDVAIGPRGNVYVVAGHALDDWGSTNGLGQDVVVKYDPAGRVLWRRAFGAGLNRPPMSICVDSQGRCYIAGVIASDLAATDGGDVHITCLDADGVFEWQVEFGSPATDRPYDIAVAREAEIPLELRTGDTLYVVGSTEGDLAGTNQGGEDAFIVSYSTYGWLWWSRQFGGAGRDRALAVLGKGPFSCQTKSVEETPQGRQYLLTSYDRYDGLEWQSPVAAAHAWGEPRALAEDREGNIYVALNGYEEGELAEDGVLQSDELFEDRGYAYWAVVRYDSEGDITGRITIGVPDDIEVRDMAIDAEGNCMILGQEFGGKTFLIAKVSRVLD
jgi:hypothetical protein